jgi:TfoX/Sxy family transcriptional regulator of competence genes
MPSRTIVPMAWIKIPKENHPLLLAALPKDPRVRTLQMFGAVAATVNGNLFGGLFARSVMVRLSPEDQKAALALDGTEPFDPMGNGRTMSNSLLLPESVMDDPEELASWLERAFDYSATLPPKQKAGAKKPQKQAAKQKPAKQAARAKPAAKSKAPRRAKASERTQSARKRRKA